MNNENHVHWPWLVAGQPSANERGVFGPQGGTRPRDLSVCESCVAECESETSVDAGIPVNRVDERGSVWRFRVAAFLVGIARKCALPVSAVLYAGMPTLVRISV